MKVLEKPKKTVNLVKLSIFIKLGYWEFPIPCHFRSIFKEPTVIAWILVIGCFR